MLKLIQFRTLQEKIKSIFFIERLKKMKKKIVICVASNSKFEETLLSRKCIPDKFDGRGLGNGAFSFFFFQISIFFEVFSQR
jgi:hypothetical protein